MGLPWSSKNRFRVEPIQATFTTLACCGSEGSALERPHLQQQPQTHRNTCHTLVWGCLWTNNCCYKNHRLKVFENNWTLSSGKGGEEKHPPQEIAPDFFFTWEKIVVIGRLEMMCWAKVDVWNIISTWHLSLRKNDYNMKHVVKLVTKTFKTTKTHSVLDLTKKVTVSHKKWQTVDGINSFTEPTHC